MYISRNVDIELLNWKKTDKRKPLLIRGARQIGKTSAIRQLGEQFTHFVEINFDENPEFSQLFEKSLSPDEICQQVAVIKNIPIIENKTLLFLDEIQASPKAIGVLRYFYEKKPNLHIIAAGSLLEFTLSEIPSFGVGRIRSVFMYPFSFEEFLVALGENSLLESITNASPSHSLPQLIHQKAIGLLKKFLVIGGMPEAVTTYIENNDFLAVQKVLDDLIVSYQTDFSKYKQKVPSLRIQEVFRTVVQQVGNKFSYSYSNATLTNNQIKEALELLQMSGLVYSITHSSCNGIPIGAEINPKKRKFILLDTGIYQRMLGLDLAAIFIEDDTELINKGAIAELFVGLELMKNSSESTIAALYYWHRESKSSHAEVDYTVQHGTAIIPIEVKSGTKGAMQSLYKFLEEKKTNFGIRTSLENFGIFETIRIIPIYAIGIVMKNKLKQIQ
ncbi:ATP-binding protein [Flavobacterium gawalongense]|uniref:ATP-binding protein n=1 Tax=Flavobacterium gawalongense TaxID=2594432 RepID=A0A553BCG0_9FLAO|nr:AAA family ATPase [Flavobacterium gawalongense]TRX00271.1 ATP-binding protein [Flavobacterium gawalongense]TRX05388.1 ATP-binding protein [Flavobacterium gawalongense]TRX05932.1 ATP-binding protein [Flavobacterium gawalongense]TRX10282.1 ATP-binding protein [Flavobacterium gawalongense]TRX27709.1 ATP-binding protein [Flavobacterium gawalongense]